MSHGCARVVRVRVRVRVTSRRDTVSGTVTHTTKEINSQSSKSKESPYQGNFNILRVREDLLIRRCRLPGSPYMEMSIE